MWIWLVPACCHRGMRAVMGGRRSGGGQGRGEQVGHETRRPMHEICLPVLVALIVFLSRCVHVSYMLYCSIVAYVACSRFDVVVVLVRSGIEVS